MGNFAHVLSMYIFGIMVCTTLVFILSTKLEFQYPFVNFTEILSTLDSGIKVAPWINVAPGTFVKNNKHSPSKKHIPLHKITEFRTFFMDSKN